MDTTTRNIARLHEALAAFNDPYNRENYFNLYDEHVILHGYADNLEHGLAGLKDYYRHAWAVLGNLLVTVEDIAASGNTVACRYKLSAVHLGTFLGIPATNRQFNVDGMTFLRFANERCIERWQSMDKLSLLRQLEGVSTGNLTSSDSCHK